MAEPMNPSAEPWTVVVVLNPAAGRRQGERRRRELEQVLEAESGSVGGSWSILDTTAPRSGIALAAAAAAEGADVVAAAGGDGTLFEVVNGIAGTGAKLGIVPVGTGNDFARALGIHNDLNSAVHALFHGV